MYSYNDPTGNCPNYVYIFENPKLKTNTKNTYEMTIHRKNKKQYYFDFLLTKKMKLQLYVFFPVG